MYHFTSTFVINRWCLQGANLLRAFPPEAFLKYFLTCLCLGPPRYTLIFPCVREILPRDLNGTGDYLYWSAVVIKLRRVLRLLMDLKFVFFWYQSVLSFVLQEGVDFCPGENVTGVTTHEQMNYTTSPVLFHLGRDPGEKYPIRYTQFILVKAELIVQGLIHFI